MTVRGAGLVAALAVAVGIACSTDPPAPEAARVQAPRDEQHAGITEPHGDHSAHHGGMVLMNGDLHYEVVLSPAGRHAVWFTDAVRTELPASVASHVHMTVSRPGAAAETLNLAIDDSGESWVARGLPVSGEGVSVTLSYDVRGAPHEIEIPFVTHSEK